MGLIFTFNSLYINGVHGAQAKKSRSSKAKVKKPTTKAEITIRATDTSPDEAAARDRS